MCRAWAAQDSRGMAEGVKSMWCIYRVWGAEDMGCVHRAGCTGQRVYREWYRAWGVQDMECTGHRMYTEWHRA